MEINKVEQDGILILNISGRLDAANAKDVETELEDFLTEGVKILLNMSELEYISSAGLRVLLVIAKKVRTGHGRLTLVSLTGSVSDVFEVSGFSAIFDIADSESEGIKMLND